MENIPGDDAKAGDVRVARQGAKNVLGMETRLTLTAIRQNVELGEAIIRQPVATPAKLHDNKQTIND